MIKTTKRVDEIKVGDIVCTTDGKKTKITHVLVTAVNDYVQIVFFENGLCITEWHPIMLYDKWVFPADVKKSHRTYCDKIYSFALEDSHVIIVNDIRCVTLGHDFVGDVISHPYFGSKKVIDDLNRLCEELGQSVSDKIAITKDYVHRNELDGLIDGIVNPSPKYPTTDL